MEWGRRLIRLRGKRMPIGNRWTALFAVVLCTAGSLTLSPAHAASILVGYWDPLYDEDVDERIPGPAQNDYLGLPINAAARMRAETWDPELLTVPEHQ
jgi:hypothetical protein